MSVREIRSPVNPQGQRGEWLRSVKNCGGGGGEGERDRQKREMEMTEDEGGG